MGSLAAAPRAQFDAARRPPAAAESGEKRDMNPWGLRLVDLCRDLQAKDEQFETDKVLKQIRDALKTLK